MLAWNPTDEPIARMVALADLHPHDRNYKRHPVAQLVRLQESLLTFGQPRPISIWRGTILAGHGVYAAARESGWQQIWCAIAPDAWTEERAAAWMVADNETARGAEVDDTALAELVEQSRAADIALEAMGFDEDALTALLTSIAPGVEPGAGGDEFDTTPEDGPTRCQPGDLWMIRSPDGREHRLVVGDCTDPAVVERLMGGDRADAVVTDPPYAFGLASTSALNTKAGGWADMMNNASWYADLYRQWVRIVPDGPIWCCINWRTLPILMRATIDAGVSMESLMVWNKDWIGPGGTRGLRPSYELIALTLSGAYSIPDRGVPDIVTVPASSHKAHGHKAEKPVALFVRLLDISAGDSVYDPFLGSGTTLIAAHRTGRRCYGIEIECKYADIVLRRCEAEGLTVERVSNLVAVT